MGEDHALGRTGGAGRANQKGHVITGTARNLLRNGVSFSCDEVAPLLQKIGVADQLRLPVVAQAAVLVVDDAAPRRAERQAREQLVDLLLVLGEDVVARGD